MKFSDYCDKRELKIILMLAVPLIMIGLVESSIKFSAIFFLARLGPTYLAAGSLVTWFFATLMIILWGLFMAVSVLVSHHHGATSDHKAAMVLRDGLLLAVLLVIPSTILIWNLAPILILFGQNPQIVKLAIPYMHALAWSPLPDFVSICLLEFFIGLGHTRTTLIVTLCWVPVNIMCNVVFIFGKLGFPALGIAGLGWGTTVSYSLCVVLLVLYLLFDKRYKPYFEVFKTWHKPRYIMELVKVGLPIGLMWFVEVSFFFVLALIMGHYGLAMLDASQITMQFVGFFVSISFATSQAVTVRMGHEIGAKQTSNIHRTVYAGIIVSVCCTLLPVSLYWLMPQTLLNFDVSGHAQGSHLLSSIAIGFFAVAALFQLLEAVRLGLFGALRALKDTRYTLFASFITFWCISIPLGYVLSETLHIGPVGYWWAMVIATICHILLLIRRYRQKISYLEVQWVYNAGS